MASRQPIDSGSSPQVSPWYAYPPACDRSTSRLPCARAIALVLLVILVLVVVL